MNLSSSFSTAEASSIPSEAPTLSLYQYKICPFCCKTKSILSYLKVPFKAVEVNPLNKKEFKYISEVGETEEDRNYKKVPVAVFHGAGGYPVRVNGSGGIASKLLTLPSAKDLPPSFASPEALEWLTWCDNVLAVRIYPALTDGFGNSVKAFSYLDGVDSFSTIEKITAKYVGALAMAATGGKIKKKYGIEDTNVSLREAVETWSKEGLGGDLGVYGVLRGLEEVGGEWFEGIVMADKKVNDWYGRMKTQHVPHLDPTH